jgi:hypothetical protein
MPLSLQPPAPPAAAIPETFSTFDKKCTMARIFTLVLALIWLASATALAQGPALRADSAYKAAEAAFNQGELDNALVEPPR